MAFQLTHYIFWCGILQCGNVTESRKTSLSFYLAIQREILRPQSVNGLQFLHCTGRQIDIESSFLFLHFMSLLPLQANYLDFFYHLLVCGCSVSQNYCLLCKQDTALAIGTKCHLLLSRIWTEVRGGNEIEHTGINENSHRWLSCSGAETCVMHSSQGCFLISKCHLH